MEAHIDPISRRDLLAARSQCSCRCVVSVHQNGFEIRHMGFQQLEAPMKNLDLINEVKYSHMNSTGSILGIDIHILQKD